MAKRGKPLTDQQIRFCDEYLRDLNATRAYSLAYPGAKSVNAAAVSASRLLRNAKVAAYLQSRMERRAARTDITQDRCLKELARLAFSNIADFVEFGEFSFRMKLRDSAEMSPDELACIQSVTNRDGQTEIKLHPKLPALVKAMQHVGLLPKGDTLKLVNANGEPMIPATAIQHAIAAGLAQGPEWLEGVVARDELRLLFPERFRALGDQN